MRTATDFKEALSEGVPAAKMQGMTGGDLTGIVLGDFERNAWGPIVISALDAAEALHGKVRDEQRHVVFTAIIFGILYGRCLGPVPPREEAE